MLKLVETHMGAEAAQKLRETYAKNGVKVAKRPTRKKNLRWDEAARKWVEK
jgi:hypothetical protein